jgi:hypothetical protein
MAVSAKLLHSAAPFRQRRAISARSNISLSVPAGGFHSLGSRESSRPRSGVWKTNICAAAAAFLKLGRLRGGQRRPADIRLAPRRGRDSSYPGVVVPLLPSERTVRRTRLPVQVERSRGVLRGAQRQQVGRRVTAGAFGGPNSERLVLI